VDVNEFTPGNENINPQAKTGYCLDGGRNNPKIQRRVWQASALAKTAEIRHVPDLSGDTGLSGIFQQDCV